MAIAMIIFCRKGPLEVQRILVLQRWTGATQSSVGQEELLPTPVEVGDDEHEG